MKDSLPIPYEVPGNVDTGISEESQKRGLTFKPRPTDVIIATFPKTGTTLLTWICHQLRTGGDVSFEDLYLICPWILLCWDLGLDFDLDQPEPRIFKSHLRLGNIYRGCKYLVTVRSPESTSISFYNFLKAKGITPVTERTVSQFVTDTAFVQGNDADRPSIWRFYAEYFQCKDEENVLVVVYEDLVKDMPTYIKLIGKWMGLEVTPELVNKVAEMSTKEYMSQYNSKLDESWVFARATKLGRSPDGAEMWRPANRVVVGKHKDTLDETAKKFLNDKWTENMLEKTGCASYEQYAQFFRDINAKRLANY